jgi:hypothetical protein
MTAILCPAGITLDAMDIRRPYAGFMAGWPSAAEVVEIARGVAKTLMGDPVTIITPKETANKASRSSLQPKTIPRYQHIARFLGPALDLKNDGSCLVLVWYANEITTDFFEVLDQVNWSSDAKDWWF